jgi:hypothetical protein
MQENRILPGVYGSEAGVVAPDDGGDIDLLVHDDLASHRFGEAPLPVETTPNFSWWTMVACFCHYLVKSIADVALVFTRPSCSEETLD